MKEKISLNNRKSRIALILILILILQIIMPIMKVQAVSYDLTGTGERNYSSPILYPNDRITYRDGSIGEFNYGRTFGDIIPLTSWNSYTVPTDTYYIGRECGRYDDTVLIRAYKITLFHNDETSEKDEYLISSYAAIGWNKYQYLVPYGATETNYTPTNLPTLTRDGYIFDGWYTAQEGGTKVTETSTYTNRSNGSLYAHWIQAASYSINDNLTYTGEEQTGITYDSETTNITGTYKATNVGDYTATLTPKDGYVWSDDRTTNARVVNWSISPAEVTIPTLSNTAKSFTDSEQSPTITGYDENTMTQTGTASAKDAGNYIINWNLKDTDNYKWNDDTITEKSANWSIGTVDIPDSMIKFEDNEVTYDGDEHSIKITGNLPGGTIEYSTDGVNYSETLPTFTDVGEYTIYYRASKSNYNDKVGSNTLKINPKALTEYTIIIENQVYTGEEIKPTIIVKDGDRIVPSTEYDLEFEDNIGPGTGKVIVKNKDGGNYTISTKNATFIIIDPGKVEFIDPTTPNSNNAKVIESADEVIAKIDFTDEDLDKINQGKNIDVYLEVKDINDSISSSDKDKIEEKLGNDKLGLYLDVSLFKKVEGEEATKITETKTPITISFEIPEELINKDSNVERTFKVLRLHDGNVEEIEVKVNGNIATFETDKFSTYALTYNDVITTSNPHTGDNIGTSFVMLIISSLGLISALGYIVISNKRKLVKTNN